MAARRVAKSAVDWTAFAAKVPAEQREFFRSFKAVCDKFAARVHQYPETLPKIDFDFYKTRLPATMVDTFMKEYSSLQIPYPADKDGVSKKVDAEHAEASKETEAFVAKVKHQMAVSQENLDLYNKIPPPERMTAEMVWDYFPDQRYGKDKPSMFPHNHSQQPGNNPNHIG